MLLEEEKDMSVVDKIHQDRYDTPKTPFALDIENLSNFEYDMQHCIKCKGCYWVDHTYMPGMENAVRCMKTADCIYKKKKRRK